MSPRLLVSGVVLGQGTGGVRRHNAELLPRLARLLEAGGGALALLEGSTPIDFELPASVERRASAVPAGPPLRRALSEGRALLQAIEGARAAGHPYELVHLAHYPVPRRLPLPYTVTIHDLRALELEHTPFSRRFLARSVLGSAFAGAAGVITVSEWMRAKLVEHFRLPPAKVHLVPNAADHYEPLPRRPAAEPYLLHIGHLEPRKNLALLIEALALAPELPPLVLVGTAKGEHAAELAARAAERGVAARWRWLGARSDREVHELYSGCAAVVLPSRLEGFGIVALEAARAGAPLAVSSRGALREVAGEDVPCFDPDDPAACAAAIRTALATPAAELEQRAARALRYCWDDSARAWLAAVERALAAARGR